MAYHIEIGGPASMYACAVPAGATPLGVIHSDDGRVGALVRFRTGGYAQLNNNAIRPLNNREVVRAMMADLALSLAPGEKVGLGA